MGDNNGKKLNSLRSDDLRPIALSALMRLLESLAEFVLDTALSAGEVNTLFRVAAVRSAAKKQRATTNRINISGIAATTGISRAEVARILQDSSGHSPSMHKSQPQSTSCVLNAWHNDPKYIGTDGKPSELKLYGRGNTFESLTRKYGRGLPIRAVLDELVRAQAAELVAGQKVRAKASTTVQRGMTAAGIKDLCETASELIATMLVSMRNPDRARIVAGILNIPIASGTLPRLSKDLSIRSADFLAKVDESYRKIPDNKIAGEKNTTSVRIVLSIYCDEFQKTEEIRNLAGKRQNFRRAI